MQLTVLKQHHHHYDSHLDDGPAVKRSDSKRPASSSSSNSASAVLPTDELDVNGVRVSALGAEIAMGYNVGAGVVNVPSFPAYLRNRQPRADGMNGYRGEQEPYNVKWVREQAMRAFRIQHDAVMSFAGTVASRAGAKVNNYWTAGDNDEAMIESLVSNALGVDSLNKAADSNADRGSSLSAMLDKRSDELRKAFGHAYDVGSADFIRKMTDTTAFDQASRSALQAGGMSLPAPSRGPDSNSLSREDAFQSAEFQRQTAAFDARAAARAGPPARAAASAARPAGADVFEAVNPSGQRAFVDPYAEVDYGPDTTQQRPFSAMRTDRAAAQSSSSAAGRSLAMSGRDSQAAEQEQVQREDREKRYKQHFDRLSTDPRAELATVDARGNVVEGITNPWLSLVRLMYNKPTETELKMWRVLWDIPEPEKVSAKTQREASLDTLEGRRKYLENLKLIQTLIGKSASSGPDWSQAPQHTGVVFFSEVLKSGIRAAMDTIHGLCKQPDVLEIDLMVQEEVSSAFADLVAYKITHSPMSNRARFPTSARVEHERSMAYRSLIRRFKTLRTQTDGMLAFADTDPGAARRRSALSAKRRAYTEETGEYFGQRNY